MKFLGSLEKLEYLKHWATAPYGNGQLERRVCSFSSTQPPLQSLLSYYCLLLTYVWPLSVDPRLTPLTPISILLEILINRSSINC